MTNEKKYRVAGWAAVLAVTAFVLEVALNLASQLPDYAAIVPIPLVTVMLLAHIAFGSYAMYRLRTFLNDRYEFHGTDLPILLLVGGGILFGLALAGSGFFFGPTILMALSLGLGIPLGLFSILFGYRLLAVNGTIGGLKKPLAYSHILAPLCFISVILAPIGLLLMIVAGALLALIFFRDESPELEFV